MGHSVMDGRRKERLAVSAVALGMMVATALLGCGRTETGPPRVAVEGEVTFRGRPLEKGSIVFIPTEDTPGPRAGAVVEAGRYRLSRQRGPVVGKLRVEIRAERDFGYDITEPTESVQHIGEPLPANDIPPEYNDGSVLVVETTFEGDNSFDFHLPMKLGD